MGSCSHYLQSAEEQDILAVASVAGIEFTAAAVAAGVEQDTEHVETRCDALARGGQFLVSRGSDEWPDGTVATRYRFSHDLYYEVLYDMNIGERSSARES